jgi:hypothetical protein
VTIGNLSAGHSIAACPQGKHVVGGGFFADAGTNIDWELPSSQLGGASTAPNGLGWLVEGSTDVLHSGGVTAYAICVNA